jgi:hypothetical protein
LIEGSEVEIDVVGRGSVKVESFKPFDLLGEGGATGGRGEHDLGGDADEEKKEEV